MFPAHHVSIPVVVGQMPVCAGPRHRCHPAFCRYPDCRDRRTV